MEPALRAVRSGSSRLRLAAVHEFLRGLDSAAEVVLVGGSRGAVDDLARELTRRSGVSFGLHRFSVAQLAARFALAPGDGAKAAVPLTSLGYEAIVTRAAFAAAEAGHLEYLDPVCRTPGFARALASTLTELRLHEIAPARLAALDRCGSDLADLLERVEALLADALALDRRALFAAALARLGTGLDLGGAPVVLLDVPFADRSSAQFLLALARRAPSALLTLPAGDRDAERIVAGAGIAMVDVQEPGESDLVRLQTSLFSDEPPAIRARTGELVWFSAPGEGRECVEIARRMLEEAARGVSFDEIAVLMQSPGRYVSLLEHALERAGIDAYFDRGTTRPDPAGRAFLALLACARERMSARRFAEYLSLAQVPVPREAPESDDWVIPDDEGMALVTGDEPAPREVPPGATDRQIRPAGGSRGPALHASAPWRWERLLVESAVIGGPDRWARRLDGLMEELRVRSRELAADDPDDPRLAGVARDIDQLEHLRAFALPVIAEMSAWPARATWGEWLARLEAFAPRVLDRPSRVLQVIAALRPMADVGPVGLDAVSDVLAGRLRALDEPPSRPRYGKVYVGGTNDARGRAFKVVFIPGLAERQFPRPIREDPLLLDDVRREIQRTSSTDDGNDALPVQEDRAARERLALRLACGAATERVYASFPRVDASAGRLRVPSFYVLELMRAATGHVPDHVSLAQEGADASGARLDWPAPAVSDRAIDDFEHDLAVLRGLMSEPSPPKGRAQYLLQMNAHLRRSLVAQWNRSREAWTTSDGIVRVADAVRPLLAAQRLSARPYSVSALQRYAACPYQFLLSAIHRFSPVEAPAPLQRLDAITRGSLVHEVQAELFRVLQRDGLMPGRGGARDRIHARLEEVVRRVAGEYAERLAPAIDRVWRDEIDAIGRDLRVWIDEVIADESWEPWRFELGFGLGDRAGHDEHSHPNPVTIDGRFVMRGSIDLVERHRESGALRVTDYKTSVNRMKPGAVVSGGAALQPVLYALMIEAATPHQVQSGRFWFCTSAGGFSQHPVPITDRERAIGRDVLDIVDRAIELGAFPPAPKDEKTCAYCDFRTVCGPGEARRTGLKSRDLLHDLAYLREMR